MSEPNVMETEQSNAVDLISAVPNDLAHNFVPTTNINTNTNKNTSTIASSNLSYTLTSNLTTATTVDWNDKMEIEFFRAVIKYRPIGKHRHFRMLNVAKEFNANSPIKCSIPELWERLRLYYNLQKLEDLEHEVEFHNESLFSEFNLIINDHENLVPSENRKSESSRGESPSSLSSTRDQKTHRDSSATPSVTASLDSSSEPEGSKIKRTKRIKKARTTRKSDASGTTNDNIKATTLTTTTTPKRAGRSRKTSDAVQPTSNTKRGQASHKQK